MNRVLAVLVCLAVCLLADISLRAQESVYFRHDFGVAKGDRRCLKNFTDDAQQLWKTELPSAIHHHVYVVTQST